MWIGKAGTVLTDAQFDERFPGQGMEANMLGGWRHVPDNVYWYQYWKEAKPDIITFVIAVIVLSVFFFWLDW